MLSKHNLSRAHFPFFFFLFNSKNANTTDTGLLISMLLSLRCEMLLWKKKCGICKRSACHPQTESQLCERLENLTWTKGIP